MRTSIVMKLYSQLTSIDFLLFALKNASASNDTIIYVFVYNPLAQNRSTTIRLPVASEAMFRVERIDAGDNVKFYPSVVKDPHLTSGTTKQYELVFSTGLLPPLGIVIFSIIKEADHDLVPMNIATSDIRTRRLWNDGSRESLELHNGIISATFDISTGLLTEIREDDVVVLVNQTWGYYTSYDSAFDSTTRSQNSGAYIFRPSVPDQQLIHLTPKRNAAKFLPTPVGIDVYAFFEEPWVWQVTRIQNNSTYVEVEYIVGPVPIDDERGKEVVARYSTPIKSDEVFFTDSNGREFQKRRRNHRPTWNLDVIEPVAGNYYPVNAAMYIEDSSSALAILVDRSQGGASLIDGSLEIMVQRRTLADDSRGVDEPLNETCGGMSPYPPYGLNERIGGGVVIKGKHRIRIGKGWNGAGIARSVMDDIFAEPLIIIGSTSISNPLSIKKGGYEGLVTPFPENIMLVTFLKLNRSEPTIFLRIGHQFGAKSEIIDLSALFADKNITSIREKTITGNQDVNTLENHQWNWKKNSNKGKQTNLSKISTLIQILPTEIKTFEVTLSA